VQDLPAPPTKKSKVKIEEVVDDSKYKADLKEILKSKTDQFDSMVSGEEAVRLGEEGWKQRYYEQKFGISDPEDQAQLIADLKRSYVEGLCWVMRYYFDGVASWRWFYPFHYAPFASDLTGIADMKVRPFRCVARVSQIKQDRMDLRPPDTLNEVEQDCGDMKRLLECNLSRSRWIDKCQHMHRKEVLYKNYTSLLHHFDSSFRIRLERQHSWICADRL
jgi:hypothetical protein